MLQRLETRKEKIGALARFSRLLSQSWRHHESRLVVWRPSGATLDITHNRELWFVSVNPSGDQTVKRYWNSFGVYAPTGGLSITVEVNIPTTSNSGSISGFFARDPETGIDYLMHDGGIGGGLKGVGRNAFLAWSGAKLVPTIDSTGVGRLGLIVAPLVKGKVDIPISSFVRRVAAFKQAVRDGLVPTDSAAKKIQATFDDYYREFSGRKRGQRAREFEYISRHGDIVDELTRWRPARLAQGERMVKNGFIDLGIEVAGKLKVLFEVKTSTDRQELYSAIGQILVHGRNERNLERYVVLPSDKHLPDDVRHAFADLQIKILRFSLQRRRVLIHGPG